jgi:hypothetical protein
MVDMTEEEWRRRQAQLNQQQYGDPLKNPDTQAALARVAAMPVSYNNGGHWAGTNVPISDQDVALGRNQASDRDVMGAGHYGVRGWANKHPLGVMGAMIGLTALGGLAGGGAAAAGGGGGAGGGAGGAAGLGSAGGLGAAGTTGSGVAGLEGVTVTGTAGGGSGLGAGLGMAGGAGAIANMPSQEQILNQYHQEQQGQLAQQPAPSIGSSSGFDWQKALQQQQGGQQQQGQQPGAMQQPAQKRSLIDRIQGGLGKVGENMFPIDQAYGMTPEQQKQARQAALMKMGLGMMAASNNGARFGDAASFGLGQAQTSLSGALQRGYENAREKRRDERIQAQQDTENARYAVDQSNQIERQRIEDARHQDEQDRKLHQQEIENKRAADELAATAKYRDQTLKIQQQNADTDSRYKGALGLKNSANSFGKPPNGYRWTSEGDLEAIPGGPATKLPTDAAAKKAMLDQSEQAMRDAAKVFFKEDGSLDRTALTTGSMGIPLSDGRMARSRVRLAVEAALRAQTGAAAPESEVERYTDMYTPSTMDSDEAGRMKFNSLAQFIQATSSNLDLGRQPGGQNPSNERPLITPKKVVGGRTYINMNGKWYSEGE